MTIEVLVRDEILDHGYVELVEWWGSDERIIEAARMSTQQGFKGWGGEPCPKCFEAGRLDDRDYLFKSHEEVLAAMECICKGTGQTAGDEKLLRYLWEHKHATPFEMAGMTIEIQAPIFVFREWHRHRTQSYNEMSARYTPLPHINYLPTMERLYQSNAKNKQSQGISEADGLNVNNTSAWLASLIEVYNHAQRVYEMGLKIGVPKEIARLPVPVARYSKMRASANLRNWLGFLTLRMDSAAQWEIREYANSVGNLIAHVFPRTWSLFAEGLK